MKSWSEIAPYVAPFGVFMLFLASVDSVLPNDHYVLYPLKIALVVAALMWGWDRLPSLRPVAGLMSVAVGMVGVVLWVGLDGWALRLDTWVANRVETPVGLDPFRLYPAGEAWLLFALRLGGIALVVPVMEELFWRGFLMRWLIRDDFTSMPLGTYQPFSFWVTTALFASVHGVEWPQGVVVGLLYGAWFVRTKSLGDVMVAHGTTNLLMALYCLESGDWHFLASVSPAHGLK